MAIDFTDLSAWAKVKDLGAHLFLPATVIVLGTFPLLYRHVRSSVSESLALPFVQAARGYGIRRPHSCFARRCRRRPIRLFRCLDCLSGRF